MKMKLFAVAVLALALSAQLVRADEYIVLDQRSDEFDRWDTPFEDQSGPVTIISRETGLPVAVLSEQRTRTRLGYGGLLIANALAAETGRSFDEIVALKQSGRGWGWIAKENNVKLGPIVSRLKRADAAQKVKVKTKHGVTEVKVKEHKANRGHGNGHSKTKGKGGGGKGNGHGKGKSKAK